MGLYHVENGRLDGARAALYSDSPSRRLSRSTSASALAARRSAAILAASASSLAARRSFSIVAARSAAARRSASSRLRSFSAISRSISETLFIDSKGVSRNSPLTGAKKRSLPSSTTGYKPSARLYPQSEPSSARRIFYWTILAVHQNVARERRIVKAPAGGVEAPVLHRADVSVEQPLDVVVVDGGGADLGAPGHYLQNEIRRLARFADDVGVGFVDDPLRGCLIRGEQG